MDKGVISTFLITNYFQILILYLFLWINLKIFNFKSLKDEVYYFLATAIGFIYNEISVGLCSKFVEGIKASSLSNLS